MAGCKESRVTIPEFQQFKKSGRKLTVVTAYDALFARIVEQAGLEAILVGDSLGMVVQGNPNTLTVTMEEMLYHVRMVARGARQALIIADMPFMSYQPSVEDAVRNAGHLLQAGAAAVKIEGGKAVADRVQAMTRFGIPVMGHVGMMPQSVNASGGYKVQGKDQEGAERLLSEAQALEGAGVFSVVLECVPSSLAKRVTEVLSIPTIGIGAGPDCDGQILVLYDLLGLFDDFLPKFVKPYAHLKADALQALRRFREEIEFGKFPTDQESFH